ncbi:hypothetical protein [Methylocystis sp. Sn-Cys]|uniref:hypothetical protein n=1 Tax=Methylocystis sp. Sn-Cys TaxID=1701263 RepID=UPI001923001F|nr:hypothetical protein [Methylocystis sp. Sn-Cys]MBL1256338.1 hypothetical protein [Methylocystis sp. Sn-Cys]
MRFLGALAFLIFTFTAAQAGDWRTYRNDRFGAAADIPVGWRMGEAPENDDGRVFTSPDGRASVTVSGSYAVLPRFQEVEIMTKPGAGETVDYKRQGRDWIVASGRKGDRIFYRKSLLSCGGTVWNSVYLDYPAAEKAAFDPIVAHVAGSLRGGKGYGTGNCR